MVEEEILDLLAYRAARGIGAHFSVYIVDGFTHGDILAAAQNPVMPLNLQWLEQVESAALSLSATPGSTGIRMSGYQRTSADEVHYKERC